MYYTTNAIAQTRIQGVASGWNWFPPVALYNFVKSGAEKAGRASVDIEQAVKTQDGDLIGSAIDRATKPITDGLRNAVTILVVGGVAYVGIKAFLVSKAAKKILK